MTIPVKIMLSLVFIMLLGPAAHRIRGFTENVAAVDIDRESEFIFTYDEYFPMHFRNGVMDLTGISEAVHVESDTIYTEPHSILLKDGIITESIIVTRHYIRVQVGEKYYRLSLYPEEEKCHETKRSK